MKIVRSLLRQLIELKGFCKKDIELISGYDFTKGIKKIEGDKKVKFIFFPFLFSNESSKKTLD